MVSRRVLRIAVVAGIVLVVLTGTAFVYLADHFLVMDKKSSLPELVSPRIVVRKGERTLELFDGQKLIKTYTIALGFSPIGDKSIKGDGRTPEGDFYITVKNPRSRFYLSLGLSYPNSEDAERGLNAGLISAEERSVIDQSIANRDMPPQKTALGGEIYIHGGGTFADWTEGCIAMKNSDIKELFDALSKGVPVTVRP